MAAVTALSRRAALAALTCVLTTAFLASPASADTASATPITAVPFSDTIDFSTAEPDTEFTDCTYGAPTEWYEFSPTDDGAFLASMNTDGHVAVATGTPGSLEFVSCDYYQALLTATSGQTYYIGVADVYDVGSATFTFEVAPPPIDIELGSPTVVLGSVPGTAVVSGSVSCNTDGYVYVNGSLVQEQGLNVNRGDGGTELPCTADAPATWSFTVSAGRAWLTKAASIELYATGYGPYSSDDDSLSQTVRIRRR
jgi:hypothetical protein